MILRGSFAVATPWRPLLYAITVCLGRMRLMPFTPKQAAAYRSECVRFEDYHVSAFPES